MDDETRRSLERFIERMKTMREGPTDGSSSPRAERPRLVIVTNANANAGQFNQPTKRRGRKPMLKLGGNVVAFRRPALPPLSEYEQQLLRVARAAIARCARLGRHVPSLEQALNAVRCAVAASPDDWGSA